MNDGPGYVERWNRARVDLLYRLARSPALDAPAVRVGLLFATFLQAETREDVRPNYQWLMKHARVSRATLSKAIKQLETAGFIEVVRYHRHCNHYSLILEDVKFKN